jgi:hypothetical protein
MRKFSWPGARKLSSEWDGRTVKRYDLGLFRGDCCGWRWCKTGYYDSPGTCPLAKRCFVLGLEIALLVLVNDRPTLLPQIYRSMDFSIPVPQIPIRSIPVNHLRFNIPILTVRLSMLINLSQDILQ